MELSGRPFASHTQSPGFDLKHHINEEQKCSDEIKYTVSAKRQRIKASPG